MASFTNYRSIFFCLVSCVALLYAVAVKAEVTTALNYFYSQSPPFEYVGPNGNAQGIGIDAIVEKLKSHNISVNFHFGSINRGLSSLNNGDADFTTAIAPTEKLKTHYYVSSTPIYTATLGVIRLKSSPSISSILELENHQFAALEGHRFKLSQVVQSNAKLTENRYDVVEYAQGINLIRSKRVKYFLTYHSVGDDLDNEELTFDALLSAPAHLAVSKAHPNALSIIEMLNAIDSTGP